MEGHKHNEAHVQVMLDHDGDGKVSYTDVQHLASLCKHTGLVLNVKSQLDATDVLIKVVIHIFDRRLKTQDFFARFDERSTCRLDQQAITTMIRFVMQAATRQEVSVLVDEFIRLFDIGVSLRSPNVQQRSELSHMCINATLNKMATTACSVRSPCRPWLQIVMA
jgi:hypothetical protein